jgi:uncharacterized protein
VLDSFCEIKVGSESYFTNVLLKEFHKFENLGNYFLLDVEKVIPHRISGETAALVSRHANLQYSGGLVNADELDELLRLGLVANQSATGMTAARTVNSTPSQATSVRSVVLFVVQECNLNCIYCAGDQGEFSDKGRMKPETAFQAIEWLLAHSSDAEVLNITFFGGEPLLNFPLIERIVEYAKTRVAETGKVVKFGITTNGSLLNEKRIEFMKRENIVPMISIDGPQAVHDRQRPFKNGKGSYEVTISNIKRAREKIPNLFVRSTLYGDADPAAVRQGLLDAGLDAISMGKANRNRNDTVEADVRRCPDSSKLASRLADLDDGMIEKFVEEIRAGKLSPGITLNMISYYLHKLIHQAGHEFGCGAGRVMVSIAQSGDIYPCQGFVGHDDMKLGNVHDLHWATDSAFHSGSVGNREGCRSCWARYVCGGGCFYKNLVTRDNPMQPNPDDCAETITWIRKAIVLYFRLSASERAYFSDVYSGKIGQAPSGVSAE